MWNLENVKDQIIKFNEKNKNWIIIIWWATATWKSSLSVELTNFFDFEIISADSRQIYRYMNIWTDKVSEEIRNKIKHYQIDILNPDEFYTSGSRKKDTNMYMKKIQNNWNIPVIVWGTWLYIDTIYKNFDMPEVEPDFEFRNRLIEIEKENPWILYQNLKKIDEIEAKKINKNSLRYVIRALEIFEKTWKTKTELALKKDLDFPILMITLWRDKDDTNKKIDKRIWEMIELWLIEEVKSLLDKWYDRNLQSMQGIWYKEIIWYLFWEYDLDTAIKMLKQNTYHYAKRQRTWFRRYIRDSKTNPIKSVIYLNYNLS